MKSTRAKMQAEVIEVVKVYEGLCKISPPSSSEDSRLWQARSYVYDIISEYLEKLPADHQRRWTLDGEIIETAESADCRDFENEQLEKLIVIFEKYGP